jgi:hypothetical protein
MGGAGFGATGTGFGTGAGLGTGFGATTTGAGFGGAGFGGATTSTAPFGGSLGGGTTGFGGGLGATANPSFGGGALGGLGGTGAALGGFGAAQTTQPAFGAAAGGFGLGTGAAAGGLGAGAGFGGFGGAMGQPNPSFGGIGQPAGLAANFGMGQAAAGGTGNPPFKPVQVCLLGHYYCSQNENVAVQVQEKGQNGQMTVANLQVINTMPAYESKSLEELRFEDYKKKQQGMWENYQRLGVNSNKFVFPGGAVGMGAPQQSTAFGGFSFGGAAAAPAPAAGGFGFGLGAAAPAPATAAFSFGGAAPAPAAGFGGFGAAFGQPQAQPAAGGLQFGAAAPAFGSPGAAGATSAFSFKPAGSPAPALGFGGFGAGAAQQPAAAAGFGGFGGFGASTAAPAAASAFSFAKPAAAPAAGFGFGLGAQPAAGFGGFGAAQPAAGFGQVAAAAVPQYAIPLQGGLERKLDSLRKKDELEIRLKDDKLVESIKRSGQLVSKSADNRADELSISVGRSDAGSSLYASRGATRLRAKIVPRGFVSSSVETGAIGFPSSQSLSSTAAQELGATTAFLRPNDLLSRKSRKLVIADAPDHVPFDEDKPYGVEETPKLLLPPPASATSASANKQSAPKPPTSAYRMDLDGPGSVVSATPDVPRSRRDMGTGEFPRYGDPTGLTPAHTESPFDYSMRPSSAQQQKDVSRMREDLDTPHSAMNLSRMTAASTSSGLRINDSFDSDARIPAAGGGQRTNLVSPPSSPKESGKRTSSNPPSLTKEGYYTRPASIEAFRMMSDDELARVQGFCVGRSGYGEIEWLGHSDIRGLDLDEIVLIEKKSVLVYHDQERVTKPPEGFGLNKPAIITLFKVLPKEGTSALKQLQFESKLKDACLNDGAEFIDYNQVTGVWMFKVNHFSKYGLAESDDEDDSAPAAATTGVTRAKTAQTTTESAATKELPALSSQLKRSALQFSMTSPLQLKQIRSLRINGAAEPTVISMAPTQVGQEPASTTYRQSTNMDMEVIAVPEQVLPAPLLPVDVYNSFLQFQAGSHRQYAAPSSSGALSLDSSPCMQMLHKVRNVHFRATGQKETVTVFSKAGTTGDVTGKVKRPIDFGLAMGRSFRVGWGPQGQLVHISGLNVDTTTGASSAQVSVLKLEDVTASSESTPVPVSLSTFKGPLSVMLKNSTYQANDDGYHVIEDGKVAQRIAGVGLWKVPMCNLSHDEEYNRFLHILYECVDLFRDAQLKPFTAEWVGHQALKLMLAAFGQEEGYELEDKMPILEDRDNYGLSYLWERRQEALSQWLQEICKTRGT